MPGNYSHITRADGTILTASIYNQDHQNHINNMTPAGVDDFSADLTEMRSTVDPGETGSESFATSLGGELQRLRFAIQEIKSYLGLSGSYWYNSPSGLVAPSLINDHSANVAQMQQTTNPGTTGSESLATDLRGELERLRYAIHQIKNAYQAVPNWYDPMPAFTANPAGNFVRGLKGYASGNTVTLSVSEVLLRDMLGGHIWKTNSGNVTANKTVVGVNGRDTSDPPVTNGFVYVYWIWGATPNTLQLVISNNPPLPGPTLPSGYTHFSFATCVYNTSTDFWISEISGRRVSLAQRPQIYAFSSTGTDVPVTFPYAPYMESTMVELYLLLGSGSAGPATVDYQFSLSTVSGQTGELRANTGFYIATGMGARAVNINTADLPSKAIYYASLTRSQALGSYDARISMAGYTVQNGA